MLFLRLLRLPFRESGELVRGFEYYSTKLGLYLERGDSAAISNCYFVYGGFYHSRGLYERSIYYYSRSIPFIRDQDTSYRGSAGPASRKNQLMVLAGLQEEMGQYRAGINKCLQLLEMEEYDPINTWAVLLRTGRLYLALEKLDSSEFYYHKLLDDINDGDILFRQSRIQPHIYQLRGRQFMLRNMLDSATFYLIKSIEEKEKLGLKINDSHGNLRPKHNLALVRIDQGLFNEAEQLLNEEIEEIGQLIPLKIEGLELLLTIYLEKGDLENARLTQENITALRSDWKEVQRENQQLSFETEQQIQNAEKAIEDLKVQEDVSKSLRTALYLVVALALLSVLVFINRFRLKKQANEALTDKNREVLEEKSKLEKEKQRSEELLLNILPAQVAEELKQNGAAKAKAYTMASVMFTDFAGFTNFSQQISAELLVDEIHACFSEYDNIIQSYGIEKIKTIGDSYMCTSGIPSPSYTHAKDLVHAALDLRDFMLRRKVEKEANGEIGFEMRIGIHSGPVVAGIVGVKKFSYDIWGDTVNTAARMEGSSEIGKVNISESTYNLIKDDPEFTFDSRGKVEVKGKGALNMYFVSRSSRENA